MKGLSFRARLTGMLLVVVILEGVFIGVLSYTYSERIVVDNKKREMADTVNRIDININTRVRYLMDVIHEVSASGLAADVLAGESRKGGERTAAFTYLSAYCRSLPRSVPAVSDVVILDEGGVVYSYARPDGTGLDEELAAGIRRLAAEHPDRTVWTWLTGPLLSGPEGNRTPMIRAVRAITDGDRVAGALEVELETDSLGRLLLGNQGAFQHQYTLIVDGNGRVVCTDQKIDNSWLGEIESRIEMGIRKFEFRWNGKDYFVCGQYNGLTGWKTYSVIALSDIFPQARLLRRSIMMLAAACTLGIAVVTALISRYLTQPIGRLSTAMKAVQQGSFQVRVPNERKDEIGKLTDAFNFMVAKIDALVKQVYQEKLAQKNAELGALQSQINPHFLYNTLDSINWMLIDKGEREISEIIISLGDLMRYAMDQEHPFVTMDQECRYVVSYLKIQKNRLENRLSYRLRLPDRLKSVEVPRLILQPLVENAITHGIEPCRGEGTVSIRVRDDGSDLSVIVEDNGRGMTACQAALPDREPDTEREGHTGIGLRNVDRRIRLHYGEDYRMRIESAPGQGTRITIRIPKKTGGGEA